jgi:type I restriction-modification system DNA methylase subunit
VAKKNKVHDHPELLGMPEVRKLWQTEGLFSDHYLKARLTRNDWWPSDLEAEPIWHFCRELYEKRAFSLRRHGNEMDNRREFIDKILERLGFAWSDNLRLPDTKQDLEPDYILYFNGEAKEAVIGRSVAERYRAGVAILEAKKFGHPLSQISKHQRRYPHQQIRDYLQESTAVSWGVLANGETWRLYCRDSKASEFFALSFEIAIKSLENFKVFLALYGPAAFVRDAEGKCRLDHVRESALVAQSELEADLRQRIFPIVEILANGFAERAENQIADADLPNLYKNCLIFLYRLLFILYAEGRGLLPVEPRSRRYYKELSLARLIPELKNFAAHDSHTRTRLYEDIRELCRLINGTDIAKNEEYKVPRYNGGLFDSDKYQELEHWRVCDALLADVLRGLLFNPLPDRQQPALPVETVDFGDLRVQQLGSIYEGLLEHHFARNGARRLELKTDKAERKATGTYYTPDYIVNYIVERTLTPLLRELEQREPVQSARANGRQDNSFANEALKLNLCDPAMGSGHFLVEATVFLADHIVYHPTTRFQAEFVRGESQEEAEIAYWRRRVVEACIYGVDLNPLAVELAKLSLWLTTIASDQPLNFLDHHLRRGNSLIGARLDQLGSLPQKNGKSDADQIHFSFGPDFKRAVAETIREILRIESESSRDVATVKNKERRWEAEILPRLAPYKKVADLWTNTLFDGPLSEEEYLAAAQEILVAGQANANSLQEASAPYHIKELDKPYFHWELEFPDVFFNDDGSPKSAPGFDAVIGNPPWEKIAALSQAKGYLDWAFRQIREGEINFYNLFLYQAHQLTALGGRTGQIVPNTWLINKYGTLLRQFVLAHFHTEEIFYMCKEVFKDAPDTVPILLQAVKTAAGAKPPAERRTLVKVANDELLGEDDFLTDLAWEDTAQEAVWFDRPLHQMSVYDTEKNLPLCTRIESGAVQLGELAHASDGIYKSTVESHKTDRRQAPSDRAVIESADQVNRYIVDWAGAYIPRALWCQHAELHAGDKIILHAARKPKLERRLVAGFSTEDVYFSNRFILLKMQSDDYSALFVLSLINSSLLNRYFKIRFPITDVDGYMLHQLPIPRIRFTTPEKKHDRLLVKAESLYQHGLKDRNAEVLLAFVAEQLKAKPVRADVVHDLLALLARQMATLNRDKLAAARVFLSDLKDFHGIDARTLNPKTKLDRFWQLEATDLFAHLRRNARTLAAQDICLTEQDEGRIRSRFQKATDTIVPLEAQISFTDQLIDQIVYRLYGLTPEAIKIVQEAAG